MLCLYVTITISPMLNHEYYSITIQKSQSVASDSYFSALKIHAYTYVLCIHTLIEASRSADGFVLFFVRVPCFPFEKKNFTSRHEENHSQISDFFHSIRFNLTSQVRNYYFYSIQRPHSYDHNTHLPTKPHTKVAIYYSVSIISTGWHELILSSTINQK